MLLSIVIIYLVGSILSYFMCMYLLSVLKAFDIKLPMAEDEWVKICVVLSWIIVLACIGQFCITTYHNHFKNKH